MKIILAVLVLLIGIIGFVETYPHSDALDAREYSAPTAYGEGPYGQ